MKYNTLDEFLDSVDDSGITDPVRLCHFYDVDIDITDRLPSNILGYSDPIQRVIFINSAVHLPFQYMLIGHELTHNVLGEEPAAYYASSYTPTLKSEKQANDGALYILVKSYMDKADLDSPWQINVSNFLEYFDIPEMYFYQVEQTIRRL
ncbi:ImmA/IrrE family metallo-endopeptidase [Agrilactobacillus fermenti]|uniref:ImmA/IrrE family metallo-endopeptidase n=1 Tax=Agrilactobacillus fermenti TaxID=2586909 RepID=UPI001E3AD514|nr:hypothetical protein [Agrilactobacillus fermenti]MCD2257101.1 hypothetical protein [Agrilactobacillus fermenti]